MAFFVARRLSVSGAGADCGFAADVLDRVAAAGRSRLHDPRRPGDAGERGGVARATWGWISRSGGAICSWLGNVLQGDFGRSFRTGQTVLQAVAERLPVSIELMLLAQIGALAIGVPLAIVCAARSGSAVRPLHDRHCLRHAVGADLPVGDPADLSVRGRAALAAGDRLCAVRRRPGRQPALHGAAGADAGAGRMAGDHARAALRHDRDLAGRLYRAGESQGAEGRRASCSCMR